MRIDEAIPGFWSGLRNELMPKVPQSQAAKQAAALNARVAGFPTGPEKVTPPPTSVPVPTPPVSSVQWQQGVGANTGVVAAEGTRIRVTIPAGAKAAGAVYYKTPKGWFNTVGAPITTANSIKYLEQLANNPANVKVEEFTTTAATAAPVVRPTTVKPSTRPAPVAKPASQPVNTQVVQPAVKQVPAKPAPKAKFNPRRQTRNASARRR